MSNKHLDAIVESYTNGKINVYMYNRMLKAIEQGISDGMATEMVQDAEDASDFGVNTDREYNIKFFINRFLDDMLDDTFGIKLPADKRKDLCRFLFSYKDSPEYKLNDLTDYRILIHKWLCESFSKKAYPNTAGRTEREPVYDLDKWIDTLKNIYASIHSNQAPRDIAISHFTDNWDADEKQHFINWMKYYEGGNMEKYDVKINKQAFNLDLPIPQGWAKQDGRGDTRPNMSTYKIDTQKTQREIELEKARLLKFKMRSRLISFKKLMDQFSDILPKQNLDQIYNEIYSLDKSLSKLNVYASIQDRIYRAANIIRKVGFIEGAELLEKTAAETIPTQDVMQSLPAGISAQPNVPVGGAQAVGLNNIISRLEGIGKTLKSRDMIRELASIDILLNELGLASYFPELSLAQAKLIEAYGYSSSKVEDIIAKLRGSGKSKQMAPAVKAQEIKAPMVPTPMPKAVPPEKPLDTGEIMAKPVGEVQKELPKAPVAPAAPTPPVKKPE